MAGEGLGVYAAESEQDYLQKILNAQNDSERDKARLNYITSLKNKGLSLPCANPYAPLGPKPKNGRTPRTCKLTMSTPSSQSSLLSSQSSQSSLGSQSSLSNTFILSDDNIQSFYEYLSSLTESEVTFIGNENKSIKSKIKDVSLTQYGCDKYITVQGYDINKIVYIYLGTNIGKNSGIINVGENSIIIDSLLSGNIGGKSKTTKTASKYTKTTKEYKDKAGKTYKVYSKGENMYIKKKSTTTGKFGYRKVNIKKI